MSADDKNVTQVSEENVAKAEKFKNEANDYFKSK